MLNPDEVANLRLWLRTSDLGQANGTEIFSIENTGSVGGLFVSEEGYAPVYRSSISPTGKPAMYFPAPSTQLRQVSSAGNYNFFHDDSGYTLFVVYQFGTTPTVEQIFIDNTNLTDTNRGHAWSVTATGAIRSLLTKGSAGSSIFDFQTTETYGGANIAYFVDRYEFAVAGNDAILRVYGQDQDGAEPANLPHSTDDASRDFTIGHRGSFTNDANSFVGHYIFEIFAYAGRLAVATIEELEEYIRAEYIIVAKNAKEVIVGATPGTAWGTELALGANDGLVPKSWPDFALQADVVADTGLANFQEVGDLYLTRHRVELSVPFLLRRTGQLYNLFFNLFGEENRSGTAPNITHQAEWQSNTALFSTIAALIGGTDVVEYPSIYVRGATLAPSGDGLVDVTFDLLGDTINYSDADALTNTTTTFGNVTWITKGLAVGSEQARIRINSQSGDALDDDDSVCAINWQITLVRDVTQDFVTQCAASASTQSIGLPTTINFSNIMLEYQLAEYDDIDVFNEFKNETEFKADIEWALTIGSTNYSILLEFPRLKSEPYEAPAEPGARIPVTRRFRAIKASANPTGMATSALCRLTVVDATDADYV